MSMDLSYPQSLPCSKASDCKESSPMPVISGPEENYASLQMSSAEMPHTETVSPLPSSVDLLIQDSPDSSTSPKGKQPTAAESSTTTNTHLSQPLLFLPPGMPDEHNWEPSSVEQPDLEQFSLEQPDLEHPVLEQPLLEHSGLVHSVLEHSSLEQSLL
ncbi:hypothetical protein P7K49_000486 [Saguinus oedipus]|uniref:Uncharacterized protein n=1 Tax=Saguinus oedipus TaxID=9490 RepID=A0ABQ9WCE0_SAGOE|nr:hypothetical protein P7K49_000486 [Saguinus oedipus]